MACTECARKSRPILKRSNVSYIARVLALALCLCLSASVCLSVCLSQVGVLSKWMDGSSWFSACRLLLTSSTQYYKEIQVATKIRVLPSGTLSKTPDLHNFASAYRSSKLVIDLARERWTLTLTA